ncbi:MAG: peptidoglycan-binding domain-containing protein [Candidatus Omnitrophota bacterium]
MKTRILLVVFLGVVMMGCSKAQAPVQTASVNSETFTLNEADTLLAQPADAANQQSVSNIVVNTEVPLADPAVGQVSDSPDEKMIQQALKNLGLYAGDIDGSIGPKTKEAIKEFQSKNNLTPDGKVGPKTWAVLKNALNTTPTN